MGRYADVVFASCVCKKRMCVRYINIDSAVINFRQVTPVPACTACMLGLWGVESIGCSQNLKDRRRTYAYPRGPCLTDCPLESRDTIGAACSTNVVIPEPYLRVELGVAASSPSSLRISRGTRTSIADSRLCTHKSASLGSQPANKRCDHQRRAAIGFVR